MNMRFSTGLALLVAALLALPACASRTDPPAGSGGSGGSSSAACEACIPASYTCFDPDAEAHTLFIESRDATGCDGTMSAWKVRIDCDPLRWCFAGGSCQTLERDADGALRVPGADRWCAPSVKLDQ